MKYFIWRMDKKTRVPTKIYDKIDTRIEWIHLVTKYSMEDQTYGFRCEVEK